MPLYVYHCNTCGKSFEMMMRYSQADDTPACPACESQDTRKAISPFASLNHSSSANSGASSSCGAGSGRFS